MHENQNICTDFQKWIALYIVLPLQDKRTLDWGITRVSFKMETYLLLWLSITQMNPWENADIRFCAFSYLLAGRTPLWSEINLEVSMQFVTVLRTIVDVDIFGSEKLIGLIKWFQNVNVHNLMPATASELSFQHHLCRPFTLCPITL
jgi:hypothetical protein